MQLYLILDELKCRFFCVTFVSISTQDVSKKSDKYVATVRLQLCFIRLFRRFSFLLEMFRTKDFCTCLHIFLFSLLLLQSGPQTQRSVPDRLGLRRPRLLTTKRRLLQRV